MERNRGGCVQCRGRKGGISKTETAAPVAGLTQHPAPFAPSESSLLQEHLVPKQEVELGDASEDTRANMGAGHTAGLGWGVMGVGRCNCSYGGRDNIVEG